MSARVSEWRSAASSVSTKHTTARSEPQQLDWTKTTCNKLLSPVWMCVGFYFTSTLKFFHSFMLKRLKYVRFKRVMDVNRSQTSHHRLWCPCHDRSLVAWAAVVSLFSSFHPYLKYYSWSLCLDQLLSTVSCFMQVHNDEQTQTP